MGRGLGVRVKDHDEKMFVRQVIIGEQSALLAIVHGVDKPVFTSQVNRPCSCKWIAG